MTCLCGDSECSSCGEAQGTKTRTKPKRTPVEAPKAFVLTGDCLMVMPSLPANSVDAVVTDPPYGLTNGGLGGFMGKEWDSRVPGPHFWAEAIRVAKPGAYLAAFGGTRTYHRLVCAIEDAGWEIRDCGMYLYGTGFPKSLSIEKALGDHPDAAKWRGYGSNLKPAWEPIVLARKPLEGTVAANVLKYGTGGLNIDGCRVAFSAGDSTASAGSAGLGRGYTATGGNGIYSGVGGVIVPPHSQGRYPANVILDEEAGRLLDEQTGTLTSGKLDRSRITARNNIYGQAPAVRVGVYPPTSGGASRFFYCAKASKSERERGCHDLLPKQQDLSREEDAPGANNPRNRGGESRKNHHPTVKPISLMRWLVRLVTPPGGFVLDPFCGSGSTGVACLEEGMRFAGIEQDSEYVEIAKARLAAAKPCPSEDSAGVQDEDSGTSAA